MVSLGSTWVTPGSAGVMNLATATAAPTCAPARPRRPTARAAAQTTRADFFTPPVYHASSAPRTPRPRSSRSPRRSRRARPATPPSLRSRCAIIGGEHRLEREHDRRVRRASCAPSPRSAPEGHHGADQRHVQPPRRRSRARRARAAAPRAAATLGQRRRRHGGDAQCALVASAQQERQRRRRRSAPRSAASASWPRRAARDLHDGERVEQRAADGVAGRPRSSARRRPGQVSSISPTVASTTADELRRASGACDRARTPTSGTSGVLSDVMNADFDAVV